MAKKTSTFYLVEQRGGLCSLLDHKPKAREGFVVFTIKAKDASEAWGEGAAY